MAFTRYQDRLADVLTILRDDLIPWTEADVEGSLEAAAPDQADDDMKRLNKLKAAEKLLTEAWK